MTSSASILKPLGNVWTSARNISKYSSNVIASGPSSVLFMLGMLAFVMGGMILMMVRSGGTTPTCDGRIALT